MASIVLQNVCVDFPVYNAQARSLKKHLLQVATGGKLNADQHGRVTIRALEDLNLTFKDGDKVGLIGHNGAGKSTMLRLLSRVYAPSSGVAAIEGDIGSLIDIGLGIDPEATGMENIYLRGGLLGLSKKQITESLDEIIEFSQLGDFIDVPVRTYSSGMHLRLAFAVSTIMRPEILIMDEWLSVGDETFKQKAEERLGDLVQASNILIIATHSRDLLNRVCNRAIWMEHGRVRIDGKVDEVTNAYFGPVT